MSPLSSSDELCGWPVDAAQAELTWHVPPHRNQSLMRLGFLLLAVVFILARAATVLPKLNSLPRKRTQRRATNYELTAAENVKQYLKHIKKATAEEERAFPGATQLRGFSRR
ncbi:hypothetical protein GQ600_20189 [Phytophthora cactorum]|nr:hypothetical protein GQ600_20189 [Phytophthora cactorum]